MTDPHKRFSDSELTKLRQDFDEHKADADRKWAAACEMIQDNTKATEHLAKSIDRIAENTAGVVALYQDVQATVRIGHLIKQAILWIAGVLGFGAAAAAYFNSLGI